VFIITLPWSNLIFHSFSNVFTPIKYHITLIFKHYIKSKDYDITTIFHCRYVLMTETDIETDRQIE